MRKLKVPKWLMGVLAGLLICILILVYYVGFMAQKNSAISKLAIGVANDATTLDPAITTESDAFRISASIYETLVDFDSSGKTLKPALAESYRKSEDGLTWIFKLRKGIKFHDGEPFNAEAVAFNFERWMNSDSPYHTGQFSYWKYNFGGFPGIVKRVTVLSEHSLEIVLNKPYAPFIHTLATPAFGIASPKAIALYNERFGEHPVGTGPYMFERWDKQEVVTLKKYDQYWGEKAQIDVIDFYVISSADERMAALQRGQIQIAYDFTASHKHVLDSDDSINAYFKPFFNIGYLALNNEKQPFNDVKVRKALDLLIDKKKITSDVYFDFARVATSFVPPMLWGYNDELKDGGIKIDEAKELLNEAGLEKPFKLELMVMGQSRNYFPDPLGLAQFIKNALEAAEIEVSVNVVDWEEYTHILKNGDFQMALMGWNGDILDPDNFLYTLFHSDNAIKGTASNYAFYRNAAADQLLKQARQVDDVDFRKQLYEDVQKIIYEDMPSIPLVHAMSMIGVSKSVKGYEPSIDSSEDYHLLKLGDVK